MKLKISAVIASIGNISIYQTVNSLINGIVSPDEIIIVLPNGAKLNDNLFTVKNNIKIIISDKKGQVYQRLLGFRNSTNQIILQLDDDIIFEKHTLKDLMINLIHIGPGSVISPLLLNKSNELPLFRYADIDNFLYDLYHYIICGLPLGKSKMGKFSILSYAVGFDVSYASNDLIKLEWLPGGCILNYKKDFIDYNFFNIKGKAYCEDILNSYIRRGRNINHYLLKSSVVYTNNNNDSQKSFIDIFMELRARIYVSYKMNANLISIFIFSIFFLSIQILKKILIKFKLFLFYFKI